MEYNSNAYSTNDVMMQEERVKMQSVHRRIEQAPGKSRVSAVCRAWGTAEAGGWAVEVPLAVVRRVSTRILLSLYPQLP